MRFLRTNLIDNNQNVTGSSNGSISISGSNGVSNYEHPTGYIWGNKYTGKETIDGDLISEGTIKGVKGEFDELVSDSLQVDEIDADKGKFNDVVVNGILSSKDALIDNATIKDLFVSGSAHFIELVIDKINSTNGSLILSPAHAELTRVETIGDITYCYFMATDGEKILSNDFEIDDLVICESFNVEEGYNEDISNKFIWKRVIDKGTTEDGEEHWFSVYSTDYRDYNYISYNTNSEFEPSDIVCTLGNATIENRQKAILLSATNPNFVEIGHVESTEKEYTLISSYTKTGESLSKPTDYQETDKLQNLISNGNFSNGFDNWEFVRTSAYEGDNRQTVFTDEESPYIITTTSNEPITNTDEKASLLGNYISAYFPPTSDTYKVYSDSVRGPFSHYRDYDGKYHWGHGIWQKINNFDEGIYVVTFDLISEIEPDAYEFITGLNQFQYPLNTIEVGLGFTDANNKKHLFPHKYEPNLNKSDYGYDYYENQYFGLHKITTYLVVGFDDVDLIFLDGKDFLRAGNRKNQITGEQWNDLLDNKDTVSLCIYLHGLQNKVAIGNVQVYKTDYNSYDFKTITSSYDRNVITNKIDSPAIITFNNINEFSLADKHVSVLSPTYNLISADSIKGLEDFNSQITQLADQIQLKVDKSVFDELGNRVTNAESSITQMADEIGLKVDTTEFDELGNVVTSNTSKIEILEGQISSTVSKTEFDNLTGTVNTIQSTIDQLPDEIILQVKEEVDLDGDGIIERFKTTGIDITNGKVEINAENTIINGNLNLNAQDNADAMSLFDEDGNEKATITSHGIGRLAEQSNDGIVASKKEFSYPQNASTVFDMDERHFNDDEITIGSSYSDVVAKCYFLQFNYQNNQWQFVQVPNSNYTIELVFLNTTTNQLYTPSQKRLTTTGLVHTITSVIDGNTPITLPEGNYKVQVRVNLNGNMTSPFEGITRFVVESYYRSKSSGKTVIGADGLYSTNGADNYLYYGVDGAAGSNSRYINGIFAGMSSFGALSPGYDYYTDTNTYTGASHRAMFRNVGVKWTNSQSYANNVAVVMSDNAVNPTIIKPSDDVVIYNPLMSDYAGYIHIGQAEYEGHILKIRRLKGTLILYCSDGVRFRDYTNNISATNSINLYAYRYVELMYVGNFGEGYNEWIILSAV